MSGNTQGRPNWTRSITLAMLAAVAAIVIGYMTGTETIATDRFYLNNTAGSVLFDHGKHSSEADTCATCHHDLFGSEQVISCDECHGDEVEPADFDHAELKEFHARDCSTCHEQVADDEQASSCRSCHPTIQESDIRNVGCTECHDDGYDPDMMEHDEFLEIEDHTCLGCHAPASISEAYHANCTDCHLQAASKQFTNDDGTVKCGSCHLR